MSCCFTCKKESETGKPFMVCTKCGIARYCTKECQKRDWPTHKLLCVAKKQRKPNAQGAGGPITYTTKSDEVRLCTNANYEDWVKVLKDERGIVTCVVNDKYEAIS